MFKCLEKFVIDITSRQAVSSGMAGIRNTAIYIIRLVKLLNLRSFH